MSIDVFLRGGPKRKIANVDDDNVLCIAQENRPPLNGDRTVTPYAVDFENNGSNDLRVDGSVTPVEFSVVAQDDKDVFLKTISIFIADSGARLNLFGALAALTNGLTFSYINTEDGESVILDNITNNLALVRLGQKTGAVGDGTSAFRLDISGGGADAYLPVLDFQETFGLPFGVRLRKGTADRLVFRVNDDLTGGITTFNIRAFGTLL